LVVIGGILRIETALGRTGAPAVTQSRSSG
jgi:hypothetical protein